MMNKDRTQALELRPGRDGALEALSCGLFDLWAPPFPFLRPRQGPPRSPLAVGLVSTRRLLRCLEPEARIFPLAVDNAAGALQCAGLDLILVESCMEDVAGRWGMAQSFPGPGNDALRGLLSEARRRGVPTAYWITQDVLYLEHYEECARLFDHVFCADPRAVQALRAGGVEARHLPPAAQPALYNPFRAWAHRDALDIPILFDGWADADMFPQLGGPLERLKPLGLRVVDSRNLLASNRRAVLPGLDGSILGSVRENARIMALKYARLAVTMEPTRLAPTTRLWMAVETAAAGVPQLNLGALDASDFRNGLVRPCADVDELVREAAALAAEFQRGRCQARRAWRTVLTGHTFGHRLREICGGAGLEYDVREAPSISIVVPCGDGEGAARAVKRFDSLDLSGRQLVLVLEADGDSTGVVPESVRGRDDVVVATVPSESFAGEGVNLGLALAGGDCCLLMGDEEWDGRRLWDMLLCMHCVDADLFWVPGDAEPGAQRWDACCLLIDPQETKGRVFRLDRGMMFGRREALRGVRFSGGCCAREPAECILHASKDGDGVLLAVCAGACGEGPGAGPHASSSGEEVGHA